MSSEYLLTCTWVMCRYIPKSTLRVFSTSCVYNLTTLPVRWKILSLIYIIHGLILPATQFIIFVLRKIGKFCWAWTHNLGITRRIPFDYCTTCTMKRVNNFRISTIHLYCIEERLNLALYQCQLCFRHKHSVSLSASNPSHHVSILTCQIQAHHELNYHKKAKKDTMDKL